MLALAYGAMRGVLFDRTTLRLFGIFGDPEAVPDLDGWRALVERIKRPKPILEIALVGKYIELPDAYLSVTEALRHAAGYSARRFQQPIDGQGG